ASARAGRGAAGSSLLLGGVGGPPAGIAGGSADHALDLVEIGLYAPETAAGEGRGLLRLASLPGGARNEAEGEQQPEPNPSAGGGLVCPAPPAVLPGVAQAGGAVAGYIGLLAFPARRD